MVVGTALATVFAAMLMRSAGRRWGFAIGAAIAAAGGGISAYALQVESFALFCVGVGFYGVNNAFVQQYRFAAAESVAPALAGRAISMVLIGAIGGAFCGPLLATGGEHLIGSHAYTGSMLAMGALQLIALLLLLLLEDRRWRSPLARQKGLERPLRQVVHATFVSRRDARERGRLRRDEPGHDGDAPQHARSRRAVDERNRRRHSEPRPGDVRAVVVFRCTDRARRRGTDSGVRCACDARRDRHRSVRSRRRRTTGGHSCCVGIGWNFLFVGGTALLVDSYRRSNASRRRQ